MYAHPGLWIEEYAAGYAHIMRPDYVDRFITGRRRPGLNAGQIYRVASALLAQLPAEDQTIFAQQLTKLAEQAHR